MKKGQLISLITVAALILSLTACGNSSGGETTKGDSPTTETLESSTPEVTTETTAEPTTEAATSGSLNVGELATLGDWEITLDSFEVVDSISASYGSFSPTEGNKYVVVHLTVKNMGTTADAFLNSYSYGDDIRAKILYQGTYEYSSTNLLGSDDDLHDESFNPLTVATGIIAFDVVNEAAESGELQLVFTSGNDSVVYNLQ